MATWTYQAVDPTTGVAGPVHPVHDAAAIDAALEASHRAWLAWRRTSFEQRAAVLCRLAELLRERADRYAQRMAAEMGKPLAGGVAEVKKCAWVAEHYAEHGAAYLADLPHPSDGAAAVRHDPLGVILAIMPWNYPFWQAFRFGAPALMAGNLWVLKHAPGTPGCGEDIAALLVDAGLPAGAVPNLRLDEAGVARAVADRRIAGVTLTGSTTAGRAVAALAGQHLKPSVLELGGSDPFIVLDDADPIFAARTAAAARIGNTGQSCIAPKRLIVMRSVAEPFLATLRAATEAVVVGDPRDPATQMGPLARTDLRDALHDQVARSVAAGARCLAGGEIPAGPGAFYPLTLLADVGPGVPAWREELFGPVLAVRVVDSEHEAIEAANDTPFGLGASLWTQSTARAARWIPEIQAGAVFVNRPVQSDPRLPFGGIGDSGWGRELGGHGIRAFTNAKTVWRPPDR